MNQSFAQLALDDFLWAELPAPAREPLPEPVKPTCRLQRRLVFRHRVMPARQPVGLRLLPSLKS